MGPTTPGIIFLKKFATGQLPFGTGKRFSFGYKLPVGETATGKYVIAVMDINDKIVELDETNNEIVFGPILPEEISLYSRKHAEKFGS